MALLWGRRTRPRPTISVLHEGLRLVPFGLPRLTRACDDLGGITPGGSEGLVQGDQMLNQSLIESRTWLAAPGIAILSS
jgi:hypothetical protein